MTIPPILVKFFRRVVVPAVEQLLIWFITVYTSLSAICNIIAVAAMVTFPKASMPFYTWLFVLAPFQLFCIVWFFTAVYLRLSDEE
jgi:hypothetical protein